MKKIRLCLFLFGCVFGAQGQEIQGQLLDSLTQERIPFATVLSNFGENTISNEEGKSVWYAELPFSLVILIFISCMGYNEKRLAITELADSLLYLSPRKSNSMRWFSPKQPQCSGNRKTRPRAGRTEIRPVIDQKDLFLRESYSQRWLQRDMKIKKSTIKEFKQAFWDSLFVPFRKGNLPHESLGELPELDGGRTKTKAYSSGGFSRHGQCQRIWFDRRKSIPSWREVKENSYFKFKSGILAPKWTEMKSSKRAGHPELSKRTRRKT